MAAPVGWHRIPCKIAEIRLDRTLTCGQSFRWKECQPGVFTGVIGQAVWQLKQSETEIFFKVFRSPRTQEIPSSIKREWELEIKDSTSIPALRELKTGQFSEKNHVKVTKSELTCENVKTEYVEGDSHTHLTNNHKEEREVIEKGHQYIKCDDTYLRDEDILKDYLQLNVNLELLYQTWAQADKHFEEISKTFTGIRMLRQEPIECLFSFICSSNNNISRITSMVEKLASNYGEKILTLDGKEYYSFPRVVALAQDGVEERLKELGFGYRAKYIQKSAQLIEEQGGEAWLYSLRNMDYRDAKANLLKLFGVGAKVADCTALMCLDKPGSVPVDTHVWQIAVRDYMPKLKSSKCLTEKLYDEIGDFFRELWGPYAGWAHSVLFAADLRQFKKTSESPKQSPKKKYKQKAETADNENPSPTKKRKPGKAMSRK